MTLVLDQVGAFSVHSTRFINKPRGFAMGWNYALQWLIVLPLELVALTITFRYWTDQIPPIALSAIFLALIFGINLFGVRGYGEIEMMFAVLKIAAVIGFSILGVVLDAGGIHGKPPIGGKYWHNPGAFKGGWNGFFNVLVIAAFAFSGTEIVCLAAAENDRPAVNLPKAVKRTFWRILIVSLCLTVHDVVLTAKVLHSICPRCGTFSTL
jgi:amino acid transporter